jgi:hypothetical protein
MKKFCSVEMYSPNLNGHSPLFISYVLTLGFASNPAGYTAANASDVLFDEDEEDELESDVRVCNAIIEDIDGGYTAYCATLVLASVVLPCWGITFHFRLLTGCRFTFSDNS